MKAVEFLDYVLTMYRYEYPGASDAAIYQIMIQELGPASGIACLMAARIGADLDGASVAAIANRGQDEFLRSFEWRRLRMDVLAERGARCECCGRTAKDGVRLNVDHIKNRKRWPHLALTPSNLQVLCEDCNHGKGNKYVTDFREPSDNRV